MAETLNSTAADRINAAAFVHGWTVDLDPYNASISIYTKDSRRIWIAYTIRGSVHFVSIDRDDRFVQGTNQAPRVLAEMAR